LTRCHCLMAMLLPSLAFPAPAQDYTDTGPLTLLITYRCKPADRPAFRSYLRERGLARFEEWKKEGILDQAAVFFNWYVDNGTWDAMAMLQFRKYANVARWKAIEESMPGGLSSEGLALATPVNTASADIVWQGSRKDGKADHGDSVFLVIPYKYLVLVSEYKKYVDGYVIPQLDGWIEADVMETYKILLNRFPTGDRWGSMLLLEYKDLDAFGRRKQTKNRVRVGLRKVPTWKAFSDRKRTIRRELEPVITEMLMATIPSPADHRGQEEAAREAAATREFEIIQDRPHLGGAAIDLWGIRCGNALHSRAVTERHVRALDTMVAHGINLIGIYIQGSNGGWPDPAAGFNGFSRQGRLKPAVARRLEWLVREADQRGMVVMVGLFSPRKDQDFANDAAIERAVKEAGRFLVSKKLRNVFVDIMHEYDHARIDKDLFREPGGAAKKARLTAWFKAVAPEIEAGVCPYVKSKTRDTYPGMEVRMIQKHMPIPPSGFVVNVETQKQDCYENDGVFHPGSREYVLADCRRFRAESRAVMLLHAAYIQGIGNYSGTAPHPEMGGYGTGVGDRGVRFYYEWVRDNVGRWVYPRHVKPAPAADDAHRPTREFEVRSGLPHLGGKAVRLWGLRCNNALMSPAVTERLMNNLDNMAGHGINLISLSLQGTNGGFPDKNAGPNAYAPDGHLIPKYARRLESIVRMADRRGMVVCITLLMPRKDELVRDEAAVRRAMEETGRFLSERGLRNVFVNLYQEFNHPTRVDHDIFQEPDGAKKKAKLTAWFKATAPEVEVGICPNHATGSPSVYPGCEVTFFQEAMPIPTTGFAVNTETADRDLSGNEGVFNRFHFASMRREWQSYLQKPNAALLFRSPYVENVRGMLGTGPNFEMGGSGTARSDRGIRTYYQWLRTNVGRWEYPRHIKD